MTSRDRRRRPTQRTTRKWRSRRRRTSRPPSAMAPMSNAMQGRTFSRPRRRASVPTRRPSRRRSLLPRAALPTAKMAPTAARWPTRYVRPASAPGVGGYGGRRRRRAARGAVNATYASATDRFGPDMSSHVRQCRPVLKYGKVARCREETDVKGVIKIQMRRPPPPVTHVPIDAREGGRRTPTVGGDDGGRPSFTEAVAEKKVSSAAMKGTLSRSRLTQGRRRGGAARAARRRGAADEEAGRRDALRRAALCGRRLAVRAEAGCRRRLRAARRRCQAGDEEAGRRSDDCA